MKVITFISLLLCTSAFGQFKPLEEFKFRTYNLEDYDLNGNVKSVLVEKYKTKPHKRKVIRIQEVHDSSMDKYQLEFSESGKLVSKFIYGQHDISNMEYFRYDRYGRLDQFIHTDYDRSWTYEKNYIYKNGRLIVEYILNLKGDTTEWMKWNYDEHQRPISMAYLKKDFHGFYAFKYGEEVDSVNFDTNPAATSNHIFYIDEKGYLSAEIHSFEEGKIEDLILYQYNEKGQLLSKKNQRSQKLDKGMSIRSRGYTGEEYEYDSQGRIIVYRDFHVSDVLWDEYHYVYEDDQLIKEAHFGGGNFPTDTLILYSTKHFDYNQGLLQTVTVEQAGFKRPKISLYEYDKKGNWISCKTYYKKKLIGVKERKIVYHR